MAEPEQDPFSKYASAIELLAVIVTIFAWAQLRPATAVALTVLALASFAGAFFIRLKRAASDLQNEVEVESAEAVVDRDVLRALREAPVPFSVIRAVKRIGDDSPRIPIRDFRKKLRVECGPDLSEEVMEVVVDFVRIPIRN